MSETHAHPSSRRLKSAASPEDREGASSVLPVETSAADQSAELQGVAQAAESPAYGQATELSDVQLRARGDGVSINCDATLEAEADRAGAAAARGETVEVKGTAGSTTSQGPIQRAKTETTGAATEAGAAEKDAAAEEERLVAAQAGWESFLGQKIGGKLFELVKKHVNPAELTQYGEKGTEALAKAFAKLGNQAFKDDAEQAKALNQLLAAIGPDLQKLANEWLKGETGQKIYTSVAEWIEEHPRTVTISVGSALIGAAVAAYCANMDPPSFKQKFKLGHGFSGGAELDLGPVQALAVQAASATIEYSTQGLDVSITGKYEEGENGAEDKYTVTSSAEAEGDLGGGTTTHAKGTVSWDGEKMVITVDGGLKTNVRGRDLDVSGGVTRTDGPNPATKVHGDLKLGDKNRNLAIGGNYDLTDDAFTLRLSRTELDGHLTDATTIRGNEEGELSTTREVALTTGRDHVSAAVTESPAGESSDLKFERRAPTGGGTSYSAHASTGPDDQYGLGGKITTEHALGPGKLQNELWLEMERAKSVLGVGSSFSTEDGYMAGFGLETDTRTGRVDHFGLKLGWKDPEEFKRFLLSYQADWVAANEGYSRSFDLLAEYALGNIAGRIKSGATWDAKGDAKVHAGVLGGYRLNDDLALLGGGGYKGEDKDGQYTGGGYLEVGVQYKNVPLTLTYTPDDDRVMVGITIPFGFGK